MSAAGWVALDEASSVFERPAWAIRAMLERGTLEKKTEGGRVFVRRADLAEAPAKPSDENAREREPDVASLVADLAPLLAEAPCEEAGFSLERRSVVVAEGAAPWERLARDLDEIARSNRARDLLLARATRALVTVEGWVSERQLAMVSPLPVPSPSRDAASPRVAPRRRARGARALVLALAFVACASALSAKLAGDALEGARAEALRSEEKAARLERELEAARDAERQARQEELSLSRGQLAACAENLAAVSSCSTEIAIPSSSATSLPAGFTR